MSFKNLRSRWSSKLSGQWHKPNAPSSDTARLYLALYARLKDPQTYHFALHLSPKEEIPGPGICETTKFHCKNIIQATGDTVSIPWIYEAVKINPNFDNRILVKVLLADVERADVVESLFAEVPVIQDDSSVNCITWVRQALVRLNQAQNTGIGVKFDWDDIQKTALEYVDMKKEQGRFSTGWEGDSSRVATFDMLLGREISA